MLEVHYNSLQFVHTIQALEHYVERPFALYAALADYYKKEKYWGRSWSRQQRFMILRGFIQTIVKEEEWQRFDELLTFDFYLRENAKSRPEWSEDMGSYREEIAAFYQKEEQERKILAGYEAMTWKQMMRMTHIEHFSRLKAEELGIMTEKRSKHSQEEAQKRSANTDCWLLFDYKNRNPLTYDASVFVISLEVQE